jgi:hypothetical protein
MKQSIWHSSCRFTVTSYGNGTAFELKHNPSAKSVFFQGDDAIDFAERWDDLERAQPETPTADLVALIWDDYQEIAE